MPENGAILFFIFFSFCFNKHSWLTGPRLNMASSVKRNAFIVFLQEWQPQKIQKHIIQQIVWCKLPEPIYLFTFEYRQTAHRPKRKCGSGAMVSVNTTTMGSNKVYYLYT